MLSFYYTNEECTVRWASVGRWLNEKMALGGGSVFAGVPKQPPVEKKTQSATTRRSQLIGRINVMFVSDLWSCGNYWKNKVILKTELVYCWWYMLQGDDFTFDKIADIYCFRSIFKIPLANLSQVVDILFISDNLVIL